MSITERLVYAGFVHTILFPHNNRLPPTRVPSAPIQYNNEFNSKTNEFVTRSSSLLYSRSTNNRKTNLEGIVFVIYEY